MPIYIGLRKWLIIFVKEAPEDERVLKDFITRLEESLGKKSLFFDVKYFSKNEHTALKKVGTKVCADGELIEMINEALVNKVININKNPKYQRVAVILQRSDLGSDEAFQCVVDEPFFRTGTRYSICYLRNYVSMTKKLNCLSSRCGDCLNTTNLCDHSCLPRLLWLLFDCDNRVKDILSDIVKNNSEFE
jgi:hypothetical protein